MYRKLIMRDPPSSISRVSINPLSIYSGATIMTSFTWGCDGGLLKSIQHESESLTIFTKWDNKLVAPIINMLFCFLQYLLVYTSWKPSSVPSESELNSSQRWFEVLLRVSPRSDAPVNAPSRCAVLSLPSYICKTNWPWIVSTHTAE